MEVVQFTPCKAVEVKPDIEQRERPAGRWQKLPLKLQDSAGPLGILRLRNCFAFAKQLLRSG